jgi:hypothetical protein
LPLAIKSWSLATGVALHAAVALRFLDGKHSARPARPA